MRKLIDEKTTVKELMEDIVKAQCMAHTYHLNNTRIRVRVYPKRQK